MREKVPNGDAVLVTPGESREVARHGCVEVESPFVVQKHRPSGRGYDLGQRGEIVNGAIGCDGRTPGSPIEPSEALFEDRITVATYND